MDTKPPIASELVREFVGCAHGDLDRVRAMLAAEPNLVNAAWDWGGGDWETALGASAHMGRRDIAEELLSRGARIDLFAAAMLGKIEIVRAIVGNDPTVASSLGPHGIPLVRHAEMGGEASKDVLELLRGLAGSVL